jgi:hypothetical protein
MTKEPPPRFQKADIVERDGRKYIVTDVTETQWNTPKIKIEPVLAPDPLNIKKWHHQSAFEWKKHSPLLAFI